MRFVRVSPTSVASPLAVLRAAPRWEPWHVVIEPPVLSAKEARALRDAPPQTVFETRCGLAIDVQQFSEAQVLTGELPSAGALVCEWCARDLAKSGAKPDAVAV